MAQAFRTCIALAGLLVTEEGDPAKILLYSFFIFLRRFSWGAPELGAPLRDRALRRLPTIAGATPSGRNEVF